MGWFTNCCNFIRKWCVRNCTARGLEKEINDIRESDEYQTTSEQHTAAVILRTIPNTFDDHINKKTCNNAVLYKLVLVSPADDIKREKSAKETYETCQKTGVSQKAVSISGFPQQGSYIRKVAHAIFASIPITLSRSIKVGGRYLLAKGEFYTLRGKVGSYDFFPSYLRVVPVKFCGALHSLFKNSGKAWDRVTMPHTMMAYDLKRYNENQLQRETETRVAEEAKANNQKNSPKKEPTKITSDESDDIDNDMKESLPTKCEDISTLITKGFVTLLMFGGTTAAIYFGSGYLIFIEEALSAKILGSTVFYGKTVLLINDLIEKIEGRQILNRSEVQKSISDKLRSDAEKNAELADLKTPADLKTVDRYVADDQKIKTGSVMASSLGAPAEGPNPQGPVGDWKVEIRSGKATSPVAKGLGESGSAIASPAGSPPAQSPRADATAVDEKRPAPGANPLSNPANAKVKAFGFLTLPAGGGKGSDPTSPTSGATASATPTAGGTARGAAELAAFRAQLHADADAKKAEAKAAAEDKRSERLAAAAGVNTANVLNPISAPYHPPLMRMPSGSITLSKLAREGAAAAEEAAQLAAMPNVPVAAGGTSSVDSAKSTPEKDKVGGTTTAMPVAVHIQPSP